jgi:hypothetical protein
MKLLQPISKLMRVGVLLYLAGSVVYTTHSYLVLYSQSIPSLRSKIITASKQTPHIESKLDPNTTFRTKSTLTMATCIAILPSLSVHPLDSSLGLH